MILCLQRLMSYHATNQVSPKSETPDVFMRREKYLKENEMV